MYLKSTSNETHATTDTNWLKRIGVAGFTFFFLKGMLWLLIPWLAHSALL